MDQRRVTVYTPESALANPSQLLREMLRDLIASRELAWRLMVRDLSAQYRQTYLGFLWAIILPLANALVWIFLNRSGVLKMQDTGLPYPVYVFTGTMLWAILMDALNAPLQVVTASKSMLAKIKFPREALVLAGVYETLANALIKVILLFGVLVWMGVTSQLSWLLVPLGILSLTLAGTVIGLILTPFGLLYNDVSKAIPLLMQFAMYLTPVVFAMPKDGPSATVFQLNPLTPLILTVRDWLTGLSPEHVVYFAVVNAVSIGLLFIFWGVFRLAMPILIERMGN